MRKQRKIHSSSSKQRQWALRIPVALSNHEMQSVSAQLSLSLWVVVVFFFLFFPLVVDGVLFSSSSVSL
jgi:hypothetical protein